MVVALRPLLVSLGIAGWCLAAPVAHVPDSGAASQLTGGSVSAAGVPREAPAGTATIRGTVVAADTGQPLRRATVMLHVAPPPDRRTTTSEPVTRSTSTDANGQFEFTRVPSGLANLSAMKDGYFDQSAAWMTAPGDAPRPKPQPIAEGQTLEKVAISLLRAGAIVGRVVDEFGDPASGVEIETLRRMSTARRAPWNNVGRRTESDDTGAFRVWGLQPGDYIVGARPRQFQVNGRLSQNSEREGFAPTFYPGTATVADAGLVTVRAGRDTTGVTFGLTATRLASIRGRVLPPDGSTASRVTVMVSRLDSERAGSGATGSHAGDDGAFEISRLPPGRYRLSAREGADGPWRQLGQMGTVEIDVDGADVEGVTIALRPGSVVAGRVVDESGQPVRGQFRVQFETDDAGGGMSWTEPATVGDDGTFHAASVFGRRYVRLLTTGPLPMPLESALAQPPSATRPPTRLALSSVRVGDADVTDRAVDFDGRAVEITIHMTSQPAEVSGTVQWAALGADAARARPMVIVFPDDPSRWHEWSVTVRAARVGPQGQFSIRGIPPGDRYLVVAVEELRGGEHLDPVILEAVRSAARPLRIDAGSRQELSLHAVPRPSP